MSYIKGFTTAELNIDGVYAEPIIFTALDGFHHYVGWNILLETDALTLQGDLTWIGRTDTYTFANVKHVDTVHKGKLLLLYATTLYVNQQVTTSCPT